MREFDNRDQIIRLDAKNSFVEFLASSFTIDKLRINFVKYNDQGKQTDFLSVYLDLDEEFLALHSIMVNGMLAKYIEQARAQNKKQNRSFSSPIFRSLKGSNDRSRTFQIYVGNKIILQAEEGPGETFGKGTVKPAYDKPDVRIRVAISEGQLYAAISKVYMAYQIYLTQKYEGYTWQAIRKEER